LKVGILSLQGSFFDHQKSLDLISLESLLVKTPDDLDKVDGIILPGGESTAMSKISSYNNLYKNLDKKIKQGLPTLSTCAGTIILAKSVIDGDTHIPNIDIEIQRNAYGRQNESFEADVKFINNNDIYCFIRAPKIIRTLNNDVKVIATHVEDIVGVSQDNIVSLTYHPELTNDNFYLEWLFAFMKEGKYVGSF